MTGRGACYSPRPFQTRQVCCCLGILVALGVLQHANSQQDVNARVLCQEPVFEFGTKSNTATITHRFRIRSQVPYPVRLGIVRPSCGCASAEANAESIPPNGDIDISVRLSLRGRKGRIDERVFVGFQRADIGPIVLVIRGMAEEWVRVTPCPVQLGRMTQDQSVSKPVTIAARRAGIDLAVVSATCSLDGVSVRVVGASEGEVALLVETKPLLPVGRIETSLAIQFEDPDIGALSVPVVGRVVGWLDVAPQELVLIDDGSGRKTMRFVEVAPGMCRDFKVISVEVPAGNAVATASDVQGGRVLIRITDLPASNDLDGEMVRILTDQEQMPLICIPIRVVRLYSREGSGSRTAASPETRQGAAARPTHTGDPVPPQQSAEPPRSGKAASVAR